MNVIKVRAVKRIFGELGTWETRRGLILVQMLRALRAFHKVFDPRKEGCAQEACCPTPSPSTA